MEDLEGEIWKPIIYKGVDYTGHYEVSNTGNIKSFKCGKEKILKPKRNSDGYMLISLSMNTIVTAYVHALVFYTFGSIAIKGYVIDHVNSNKLDNSFSNLRLVSVRDNISKEKTIKSGTPTGVQVRFRSGKRQILSMIAFTNNKQKHLGYYKTVESASYAYQLALAAHEKGFELEKIFKVVDDYRIILGLKPIKRRNL